MSVVLSVLQGALESCGISEAKCSLVFPLGSHDRKTELKAIKMILKFSFHLVEKRLDLRLFLALKNKPFIFICKVNC